MVGPLHLQIGIDRHDRVDDTLHDAVEMGPLLAEFLLDALALAQRGRKLPQERVGLADQEADLRAPVAAGNPNQRRRRRTRVYFAQIVRYAQDRKSTRLNSSH